MTPCRIDSGAPDFDSADSADSHLETTKAKVERSILVDLKSHFQTGSCVRFVKFIDVHLISFQENRCLFIFFSFHDVAASKGPTPDRVFQQECET